ncbi:MAG: RnfABCDGE type electron transport complex subunit D [Acidobacteriota bacterium]
MPARSRVLAPTSNLTVGSAAHDPRLYQIAVLGGLLIFGVTALDIDLDAVRAAVTLAVVLLTQAAWTRIVGLARFDPRSALISGLSLCLLLRTPSPWIAAAAATIAISSKFVLRARGRHVFNPANFGLLAAVVLFDAAWISPGQWGSTALWLGFAAAAGGLVVRRARRSDVTLAFLTCWIAVQFGRAAWLGDPLVIPLRRLESGALLIFAFFMISDPKTTPATRVGRLIFAALVATVAAWIEFGLFKPNGPIWALVLCAPAVPLIDLLLERRAPAAIGQPSSSQLIPETS